MAAAAPLSMAGSTSAVHVSRFESCQQIVARVNEAIQSSHAILSRITEMPPTTHDDLPLRIGQLGWKKVVAFEWHEMQVVWNCLAVTACKIPDQETNFLARTKFGIGNCGEMAVLALVQANQLGSCLSMQIEGEGARNHAFIILMPSEEAARMVPLPRQEKQKMSLHEWLQYLPEDAIVLDPFLKSRFMHARRILILMLMQKYGACSRFL